VRLDLASLENPNGGGGEVLCARYSGQKRPVSIDRVYDVENENGEVALKLDGKVLSAAHED
jgi:hypothetical protein